MSDLQDVGKLRRAMMPLFKMLPDSLIDANEKRFALLEKKLEELSMQQPEVTVTVPDIKAPEVTVQINTDAIVKALQKSRTPEPPSAYEPHDQAKSQLFQYSGFIRSDGAWYIQRVAKGEQRYAKGSGSYTDAWDKRSKLKYGYIDA